MMVTPGFVKKMTYYDLIREIIIAPIPLLIAVLGATILCVIIVSFAPFLYPIGGFRIIQKFAMSLADPYWAFLIRTVEQWGHWQILYSGDRVPLRENAIIMANHRWYLDWLLIFTLAIRKGRLGCCKFFAKSSVKWIPGIGWGIAILGHIFLERNWLNDLNTIEATFRSLKERKFPFWLVSHLEGTRFNDDKLLQSQAFAKKKDLPVLNHVLLPRTKGFVATVKGLRSSKLIDAVYDITIMYNDGIQYPTVASVLLRQGGKVNIHVRRYSMDQLPDNDEDLAQWVNQRWKEKDQLIEHFMKHGEFPQRYDEPFVHVPMLLN